MKKKRGPVFEGLPTVEAHRNQSVFTSFVECVEDLLADEVLIGDIQASRKESAKIQDYINNGVITLEVEHLSDSGYIDKCLSNRKDVAMNVVRCVESRTVLKKQDIVPYNTVQREVGAITMDNERYGRYQGELQIVKRPLEADDRVNVIGEVCEASKGLLQYIKEGTKFKFIGVEKDENNHVSL